MAGMFDDLVPAQSSGAKAAGAVHNAFADLVPRRQTAPQNPFAGKSDDEARAIIATVPPEKKQEALNLWADAYVAKEREQGGVGMAIDNGVRAIARGTPIGSWLDEATALGASATGGNYDETLAYQRAKDRAYDAANPVASTALQIGGGIASAVGGAGLVANGAKAGATQVAPSLGGKIVRGLGAGAAAGGVYGAGLGEGSLANRAYEGAKGAALGGVVGAAAPAIATGIGKSAEFIANQTKPIPGPISAYAAGAVKRMAKAVGNEDLTKPGVTQRLADLGQEAIPADYGRTLEDLAGGIAATQTGGAKTVVSAIGNRAAGAATRMEAAVTGALGQETNVPALVEGIKKTFAAQKAPAYEQFRATPVPYTFELSDIVDQLKNEPSVLKEARRFANLDDKSGAQQFFAQFGNNGTVSISRIPNAAEWDYIHRALAKMAKTPKETDQYIYGSLDRKVKDAVDAALSPGDPSASIWAKARSLHAEDVGLREAVDAGKQAFAKNLSPDEMAAEMAQMSQPEQMAYKIGARQQVRDIMGNAGTKFGEASDTAAMRLFNSKNAKAKVDTIAPGKGAELARAVKAEGRFAATEQNALQNSRTAARQGAKQMLPADALPGGVGRDVGGRTIWGTALEGVYRGANMLTAGALQARREQIIGDMAKMLTAQGQKGGEVLKSLIDYNNSLGASKLGGEAWAKIIKAAVNGTRQAVINSTGPQKKVAR